MFKTISAAALGLGLVLAVPAQAQPSSVQVRYGDLDLRHDAGVATLDRRIDAAVRSVCGNPREQTALPMVALVKRCGADARVAVQDQRKTAIDRARGRQPYVEVVRASAAVFTIPVGRR